MALKFNKKKKRKRVQTIFFDIIAYFEISVFEISRVDYTQYTCAYRFIIVIQWIKSCHKNHMTTRNNTLARRCNIIDNVPVNNAFSF